MTIIAFGRLRDCTFIVADRINYVPTDDPDSPEAFGLKRDKIAPIRDGFVSCTGDRLVYDFLLQHNAVYDVPSYTDEGARLHFVNELNILRRQNNTGSRFGRNTGVVVCMNNEIALWRIEFDRATNLYRSHDFGLATPETKCILWFGRTIIANHDPNLVLDNTNFVEYFSAQLSRMLGRPENEHRVGNFLASDFLLDEVNFAYILSDGTHERGSYRPPI